MSTGLQTNNPTIVSAFYAELLRQGLVVAVIALAILVAWAFLRSAQLRQAAATRAASEAGGPGRGWGPRLGEEPGVGAPGGSKGDRPRRGWGPRLGEEPGVGAPGGSKSTVALSWPATTEAPGRRLIRVGFGLLWVLDGVLQAQKSMPLGMPSGVIQPAAVTSPAWVQHIDETLARFWSYHPVVVPASAVWIQVGIGIWLLAASRGTWSRLGGVASAAWGLLVWAGGEAFGQVFAPGQSWLFGLPGAVLFYCAAGALVALPEHFWENPGLGRWCLRGMGAYWLGMALLQAWPGRGFWQGHAAPHSALGQLTSMAQQMATTRQPHLLSSWIAAFASFDAAHGWAVNLFVVVALAAIGILFVSGRRRLAFAGVIAGLVLCAATWVLVQDLGFLGGVGTDPNSMIPNALLFSGAYLAMTRVPSPARAGAEARGAAPRKPGWFEKWSANPSYTFRCVLAGGALAVTLVGTAPAAVAAANPNANPLLTQAINGPNDAIDFPAPAVSLVDQYGKAFSLSAYRGKVVVFTFLDPVCTSDCPVIAQELKQTDAILGSKASRVELVAVDANPRYIGRDFLTAFDAQEGMNGLHNWLYLTGTLPELEHAWRVLGATVDYLPGGAMVDHSEYAYVIGPDGHVRYDVGTEPGQASAATKSSFAANLVGLLQGLLARR